MNYYIASCSCGKDSLAMVLRLIKEKKPLDEIVFYDTDMEFKCIYDNWLLLKCYAGRHGIKCTRLEPKCSFLYTMFENPSMLENRTNIKDIRGAVDAAVGELPQS